MTLFHEKAWRQFAARWKLNLKQLEGVSYREYEYAATRTARAAWEERSLIASEGDDVAAIYNTAIQHASEVAFQTHGAAAAKAIQELRK